MTLIAAYSANPLAALLPVLTNSLASERHKARVERVIGEIAANLEQQKDQLQRLSDEQYKLVNETILAVFHTTDARKLEYLRAAVSNGLAASDLVPQEAVLLSRVIRDISADEAEFLVKNFSYRRVQITSAAAQVDSDVLVVRPSSRDGLVATGLIALGLLAPGEATMSDSDLHRFSPIVAKLLVLLRTDGK